MGAEKEYIELWDFYVIMSGIYFFASFCMCRDARV